MKIDLNSLKNKITPENLHTSFFDFLERKSRWLVFALALIMAGYSCLIWHKYIYDFHWSEERKQEYIRTKEKGTSFKKAKFDGVVSEIQRRSGEYEKSVGEMNDIFRLGSGQ